MSDPLLEMGDRVMQYLHTLDDAVERLSLHQDGDLSQLPGWYLTHRRVTVGYDAQYGGVALSVIPDEALAGDEHRTVAISSLAHLNEVVGGDGWTLGGSLQGLASQGFTLFGDLTLTSDDRLAPAHHEPWLKGWGALASIGNTFSEETARTDAVEAWARAHTTGLPRSGSIALELKRIFDTFQAIVKRKAFLERRIHRFLYAHKAVMLPEHQTGYSEVVLRLGEDSRKADLVLQREEGMPAWLIELERPDVDVVRQNGDLTAPANHACQQIATWARFIEQNPANTAPPFDFLQGPKQRLVIIGRGLEHRERLLQTRYDDTLVWTYDILLDGAERRWAEAINSQRALVGLPRIPLFGRPA
jgi:hypothetical protein